MKSLCWLLVIVGFCTGAIAQSTPEWRSWNQPVEPFRIIGNIYYVGASDIAVYLITSPQGHIVLDGGFQETAPQVEANIRKLGFKVEDVKYLLNSQAHFDHAAGLAELKQATHAQFVASKEDGALIARGGKGDFQFGDKYQFPPVQPDRIIADGETVSLGPTTMTARITPGHTKGCTTWTMPVEENGHRYDVVFFCSTSAPGYKLVHNEKYPGIVQDYRATFKRLKTLPCDVFLGAHAQFFNLQGKQAAMKRHSASNPFVDPQEFRDYLTRSEAEFENELKRQQSSF